MQNQTGLFLVITFLIGARNKDRSELKGRMRERGERICSLITLFIFTEELNVMGRALPTNTLWYHEDEVRDGQSHNDGNVVAEV